MKNLDHSLRIPSDSLPLIVEAYYGIAIKPQVHVSRTAPFNVLIYVMKGSMEIIEDDVTYTLTPGAVFILTSKVHHFGRKPFAPGTEWYYVHFYTRPVPDTFSSLSSGSLPAGKKHLTLADYEQYTALPKLIYITPAGDRAQALIQAINCYNHSLGPDNIRANMMFLNFLFDCYLSDKNKNPDSRAALHVKKITNYIEAHYNTDFTSRDLSEHLGLTYKYAGSLFKAACGMTIKNYQLLLRLSAVEKLLTTTSMTLSEIAAETGFSDSFYLSHVFKREKGKSPSLFRKEFVPKT